MKNEKEKTVSTDWKTFALKASSFKKNVTSIMILPRIQIFILPSKTTISQRASLNSS